MSAGTVPFVGIDGVKRIHPAKARRLLKAGEAVRPRGKSFRLLTSADGVADTLRERRRDNVIPRIRVECTGRLFPKVGVFVHDGRWFRGIVLALVAERLGIHCRDLLSNHQERGRRKSVIAFSVNASGRSGFLTLMAPDDAAAVDLFDRVVDMLVEAMVEGYCFQVRRGRDRRDGEHEVKITSVRRESHRPRGIYVGVIAPTEEAALAMVPGSVWAEPMGEGGHRGYGIAWKVKSMRTHRLPVQIGPCGAYGCGLLH